MIFMIMLVSSWPQIGPRWLMLGHAGLSWLQVGPSLPKLAPSWPSSRPGLFVLIKDYAFLRASAHESVLPAGYLPDCRCGSLTAAGGSAFKKKLKNPNEYGSDRT